VALSGKEIGKPLPHLPPAADYGNSHLFTFNAVISPK
jgi:hypothetical protein